MTIDLLKDLIWHRALSIPGMDKDFIRLDYAGAIIHWDEFNLETEFGWVLVPILPHSRGGKSDFMSLIPLHHQNAKSKGDNFPKYTTILSEKDGRNVVEVSYWDFMQKIHP